MGVSAESYIDSRPKDLQPLLNSIREVLLSLDPILVETIKYNTPFYMHKGKNVCYLSTKNNIVQVGFVKGFQLSDQHQLLVSDNRSIVRALEFASFSTDDKRVLLETVYEAIEL